MIQRFLWEAPCVQQSSSCKSPTELHTEGSVWAGVCVTGLAFNHILRISEPRKSHSCPALEKLDGRCTPLVQCSSSRNPGDWRTWQLPVKDGRKGHRCEASSASVHLPLQDPVLHPHPPEIKESPRQTGLTAVLISVVWGCFFFYLSYACHVFVSIWFNPNAALQHLNLIQMSPYFSNKNFTSKLVKKLCKRTDLGTALEPRYLPPAHVFGHHFWVQL